MEMKEYKAPEMEVIELKYQKPLMDISGGEPEKNDDPITDPW